MQTPFVSVLQYKLVEGGKRKQVHLRTVVRAAKEAGRGDIGRTASSDTLVSPRL